MTDMENPGNGRVSPKVAQTPETLRKRLQALMGEDILAYIDFELPPKQPPDEAQKKHAARTARYKQKKALQMAPDSEAVRQATSNVLLDLILDAEKASTRLFIRSMEELIEAGYDQEESRAAILRLLSSFPDRRAAWHRRTRQKLGRAVIQQLRSQDK